MSLDLGDRNSVRLNADATGDKTHVQSDSGVASELLRQMEEGAKKGDGNFIRRGGDSGDEFIFRATPDAKDPVAAIEKMMKSPEMQKVVTGRESVMKEAEENRRNEVARQNEIRAEEYRRRVAQEKEAVRTGIEEAKQKIDRLTENK